MSEFFDFDAYERDMNEVETMTAAIESRVKRTTPERRLHTSGDASGSPSYGFTIFPQTPFTSSAPSPMLSLSLSGSDMDVDLELTAHSPVNEANTRSASTFPAVGAEGNIPSGKEGDGANGSRVTGSKRKSKSTHYEDQTGEDLSVNMYNYLPFFSDPREIQTPPELHVAQAKVEATTPEADAHYPSMNTNTKTESSIAELAPSSSSGRGFIYKSSKYPLEPEGGTLRAANDTYEGQGTISNYLRRFGTGAEGKKQQSQSPS